MDTLCTACAVMIVMDIVCGVVAAAKNHVLDSSIMRDGMYNKVGEILLLVIAMFCRFLLSEPPLSAIGIPAEVTSAVAIYIVGMELLSILENICKINPDLPISKVLAIFNIEVDIEDTHALESTQAPKE